MRRILPRSQTLLNVVVRVSVVSALQCTYGYVVLQLSPTDRTSASRFTNLVMRLLDQVVFSSFVIMLS
jgi:hypothetical protein